ncbi:MAG: hypothetical protein WCP87_06285, partial [Atribacterota bacterium]
MIRFFRLFLSFKLWNFLLYGVLLILVLWMSYALGNIVIYEGEIIPRDIMAIKTVEIVDVKATEELKNNLLMNMMPVYRIDEKRVKEGKGEYGRFFEELGKIRLTPANTITLEIKDGFCRTWKITPRVFDWMISASNDHYENVKNIFLTTMDQFLIEPIREGKLE